MKEISIFIVFMILIYNYSKSQSNENDLDEMNLRGQVHSVEEISYKAVLESGQVVKGERYRQSSFDYDSHILFNKEGNKTEYNLYTQDEKLHKKDTFIYKNDIIERQTYNSDGSIIEKKVYKYINGKIIEEKKYSSGDSAYLMRKDTYEYYPNGNLSEWGIHNNKEKNEYKWNYMYNDDNKLLESTCCDSAGRSCGKMTYIYFDKGKIENCRYDKDGILYNRVISLYNDERKKTEEIYYSPDSIVIDKQNLAYDYYGNITEYKLYNSNNKLEQFYEYEYKYDNTGNWILKTIFRNNEVISVIEREISYY